MKVPKHRPALRVLQGGRAEPAARYYTLNEARELVPAASIQDWVMWSERRGNWHVAYDEIGDSLVSTVFLGVNHNWNPDGPPLVFETLVQHRGETDTMRWSSWDEAAAGHALAVTRVRKETA